jgi:hypothetical protein
MNWREWLISALIVTVVAVQIAEGVYRLESWPLSSVPMFSRRIPPERVPWRIVLLGTRRDGVPFVLTPADFRLTPDELGRRLGRPIETLPERCAQLGRLYNADPRFAANPLTALSVRATKLPRPGVPMIPVDATMPCPLGTPAG